ncbi:MAG: hypothetical protein AB1894_11535 [Chloroflexota bacterium]
MDIHLLFRKKSPLSAEGLPWLRGAEEHEFTAKRNTTGRASVSAILVRALIACLDGAVEYAEASGGAAMLVNEPWVLVDYKQVFGYKSGVVVMPTGPQGPAVPLVGIDGFYVSRFSKNTAVAVSLALLLTSPNAAQVFVDKGGHVPVNLAASIQDPLLAVFSQAASTGFIRPQSPEFENYWGPFDRMFVDVLVNNVPPEQAVITACAEMNRANGK